MSIKAQISHVCQGHVIPIVIESGCVPAANLVPRFLVAITTPFSNFAALRNPFLRNRFLGNLFNADLHNGASDLGRYAFPRLKEREQPSL
jgi:hypothetical protein